MYVVWNMRLCELHVVCTFININALVYNIFAHHYILCYINAYKKKTYFNTNNNKKYCLPHHYLKMKHNYNNVGKRIIMKIVVLNIEIYIYICIKTNIWEWEIKWTKKKSNAFSLSHFYVWCNITTTTKTKYIESQRDRNNNNYY